MADTKLKGTPATTAAPSAPSPSRLFDTDSTVPGGVYVDGKTGRVHDAEGRTIDPDRIKALGVVVPAVRARPVVMPDEDAAPAPAGDPLERPPTKEPEFPAG